MAKEGYPLYTYRSPSTPDPKTAHLKKIREEIGECTRCPLSKGRTHIVFGEGHPSAKLLFVGEGPGEEEDRTGRPFVGRAGELLTRLIGGMGLKREEVYIANVVKCRPPGNREPEEVEIRTCLPFLEKQIEVIQPEVIVTLGKVAMKALLKTVQPISEIRGIWQRYKTAFLLPTYHPAYLLRNPRAIKIVEEDLKKVTDRFGNLKPAPNPSSQNL